MKESLNSGSDEAPVRKSVVVIVTILLLAVLGGLAGFLYHRSKTPEIATTQPEQNAVEPTPVEKAQPIEKPEPVAPRPVTATSSTTTRVAPPPVQPQVSPYARQIVTALAQLNMTNGPVTAEKLAAWRNTIQMLTNQGPAALPAIREFLESKQDMKFDGIGGSSVMGQPSLRLALVDSLLTMNSPEARGLASEAMRSSTDPREIAMIARNLEQLAPGEFSQAALDAARSALAQAQDGKVSNVDVAALFDVLQRYGGAEAVQDFQNAKGSWTYYSAIALGGLPEGKGIPALIAMAQDTTSSAARGAALQALAQWPDSEAARNALLEQARTGQLGNGTWMRIGSILGGEQFGLGADGETGLPPVTARKLTTSHLASGNQNFYTTSILDQLSADQINQRLQLLDQLMAGNSNQAATEALKRARTALMLRLQPQGAN